MIYLIHLFIGCLIGGYFHSIPAIIILALASHFLLDMLPHLDGPYDRLHFEKTGNLKVGKAMYYIEALDFLIVLAIVIYFSEKTVFFTSGMMLGVIASLAPDILKAGYFTPLKKNKTYMKYLHFHSRIQNEVSWKFGILNQTIMLAALIVLFHFV